MHLDICSMTAEKPRANRAGFGRNTTVAPKAHLSEQPLAEGVSVGETLQSGGHSHAHSLRERI